MNKKELNKKHKAHKKQAKTILDRVIKFASDHPFIAARVGLAALGVVGTILGVFLKVGRKVTKRK